MIRMHAAARCESVNIYLFVAECSLRVGCAFGIPTGYEVAVSSLFVIKVI